MIVIFFWRLIFFFFSVISVLMNFDVGLNKLLYVWIFIRESVTLIWMQIWDVKCYSLVLIWSIFYHSINNFFFFFWEQVRDIILTVLIITTTGVLCCVVFSVYSTLCNASLHAKRHPSPACTLLGYFRILLESADQERANQKSLAFVNAPLLVGHV